MIDIWNLLYCVSWCVSRLQFMQSLAACLRRQTGSVWITQVPWRPALGQPSTFWQAAIHPRAQWILHWETLLGGEGPGKRKMEVRSSSSICSKKRSFPPCSRNRVLDYLSQTSESPGMHWSPHTATKFSTTSSGWGLCGLWGRTSILL